MQTITLTNISTENMPIEKFMQLKRDGKLTNFKIRGIVPPSISSKKSGKYSFGSIQVENLTPIYKAL